MPDNEGAKKTGRASALLIEELKAETLRNVAKKLAAGQSPIGALNGLRDAIELALKPRFATASLIIERGNMTANEVRRAQLSEAWQTLGSQLRELPNTSPHRGEIEERQAKIRKEFDSLEHSVRVETARSMSRDIGDFFRVMQQREIARTRKWLEAAEGGAL